jgi:hypothetical protein
VRYADDLVAGFEHEDDARRFLDAMRERFEAFSLSLHPDKTRLIEFGRHAAVDRKKRGVGRPERRRLWLPRWAQDRGRDAHCWAPPAQIRTGPIRASGAAVNWRDYGRPRWQL